MKYQRTYSVKQMVENPQKRVKNKCCNGACSGCGECCTDLLPLTVTELERIKKYVDEHHLSENRHTMFWNPNTIDLTCPFRNDKTQKCEIYPVRPKICREFICNRSQEQILKCRDKVSQSRYTYSLRYEFFNNPESMNLVVALILKE